MRLYGLVQFYPILFIPLILLLFPSGPYTRGTKQLLMVVAWYVVAKICEYYDAGIYSHLRVFSGHSLKHLAAAILTYYLIRLYEIKHASRKKIN